MDKVINLGIPHIREQIFENIDTDELLQYLKVSHTWKILAERVLLKRGGKTEYLRHVSVGKQELCN